MEKIIENTQSVIGQELKYNDLCTALAIPAKEGNAKKKQLKWLSSFTDLTKLNSPTRYRIDKVYPDIYAIIDKISTDECQAAFDAALYCKMLGGEGYPLYISNLELLLLFNEINNNFLNLNGLDTVEAQIGNIVYDVLVTWTTHRLESMARRGTIRMIDGYRVYTKHYTKEGLPYLKKHNVTISSNRNNKETLDGLCDAIFHQAKNDIFPTIIWKDKNNKAHHTNKINPYLWPVFNNHMNSMIQKETDGKYVKLKRVKVIFPPDDKTLIQLLNDWFKKTKALNLKLLNTEAQKRITKSQKLKQFASNDINNFIKEFISIIT